MSSRTPSSPEAFIYDAIRTPRGRGKRSGSLHTIKPVSLVVGLVQELQARHPRLDPAAVDDLVLGIVSPVGDQGSVLPRTAALAAGLPDTVSGLQLNRFCGSGLEAVNTAAQKVRSGWDNLVIMRRRRIDVAGASGRRRRRLDERSRDELRDVLHPAGRERGPDRHHRGLHPRDRRLLRGALAASRRGRLVRRLLHEVRRAGARSQRHPGP